MRAADEAQAPIVADRFLDATLRSIRDSSQITEHEKAVAQMGLAMGNGPDLSWQNSTRALHTVTSAIASSVAGPLGSVLAQVALKAFEQADRWSDADHFAGEGLQTLARSPEVGSVHREIAQNALNATRQDLPHRASAKSRAQVLREIVHP